MLFSPAPRLKKALPIPNKIKTLVKFPIKPITALSLNPSKLNAL